MRYTPRQLKAVRRSKAKDKRNKYPPYILYNVDDMSFGQRIFAQVRLNNDIANGEYGSLH